MEIEGDSASPPPTALCIGEVLWDVYPDRKLLGGAPFNVACHLRAFGVESRMVSRVGADDLGAEILEAVKAHGLPCDTIQVDPTLPTGRVLVTLDAHGVPVFRIEAPAAWDAIVADASLENLARCASAVVFGSLAQRREPSRSTIRSLLRTPALKVFDVNLRPPYISRGIVEHLLHRSDLVKLNNEEMAQLAAWFALGEDLRQQCEAMARNFGLAGVCVTRGAEGAVLWYRGGWWEHAGFRVDVVDTVGSGDAFLAALLAGLLRGESPERALARANAAGAWVAGQPGGTPELDLEAIERMTAA